jgi:hypothetical protein
MSRLHAKTVHLGYEQGKAGYKWEKVLPGF